MKDLFQIELRLFFFLADRKCKNHGCGGQRESRQFFQEIYLRTKNISCRQHTSSERTKSEQFFDGFCRPCKVVWLPPIYCDDSWSQGRCCRHIGENRNSSYVALFATATTVKEHTKRKGIFRLRKAIRRVSRCVEIRFNVARRDSEVTMCCQRHCSLRSFSKYTNAGRPKALPVFSGGKCYR